MFGYHAAGLYGVSLAMRVLAGLLCMLVAAGAELYFLMKATIIEENKPR